ncbi:MAG: substrate-binding domain-containing protein, partial [Acetobacteraceae bacterium]
QHGFVGRVRAAGARVIAEAVLPAPSTITAGREALRALIPRLGGRSALFCSSDLLAFGAIVEAQRHAIRVPDQLAVCGFGDFELGAASEPAVTTVTVEGSRIGCEAAAMILGRVGELDGPRRIDAPFRILQRNSS